MRVVWNFFLRTFWVILSLFSIVYGNSKFFPGETASARFVPNVYLDCWYCDFDYIRTEIPYVNYVYDRANADIHIMITRQQTGSRGREYSLIFLGQGAFESRRDTLAFTTLHNDTDDEIRRKLTHEIEIGLIPFIYDTDIMKNLTIDYEGKKDSIISEDKWKFWFFRINLGGKFNDEATASNYSFTNRFSADRITDDWKIRFSSRVSYDKDSYKIDEETLSSSESHKEMSLLVVKSLTNHWSVGMNNKFSSSTYDNISSAISASPGIEYNFYPYSESTTREFRMLYEMGYEFDHYYQETVFNKTAEQLFQESLKIAFETKNPWGRINISLRGSHFFHDLTKNHLSLYSELSLRLFKGFSLYMEGGYSRIRDQLSLPKTGATKEEILLRRRELETQYSSWGDVGLEFSFGSIYNNVVNPRFGD